MKNSIALIFVLLISPACSTGSPSSVSRQGGSTVDSVGGSENGPAATGGFAEGTGGVGPGNRSGGSSAGAGGANLVGSGGTGTGGSTGMTNGGASLNTGGMATKTGGVAMKTGGAIMNTGGATTKTGGVIINTGGVTTKTGGVIMNTGGVTTNTGGATVDSKSKKWVFIMLGQSNMAGQAMCEAEDVIAAPRVFKMARNKTWAPGHELFNINPWRSDTGEPCKVGDIDMGPSRAFGVNVIAGTNDAEVDVRIINLAYSGSNIESWNPEGNPGGDEHYAGILPYLDEAMKIGVFRGFIWHQGEANSGTPPANYAAKLAAIIAAIRSHVGVPNLPVVAGEVGTTSDDSNTVNQGLALLAQSDTHFAVATSENLTLQDNVHYDSASQREYGKRYAVAWRSLVNK